MSQKEKKVSKTYSLYPSMIAAVARRAAEETLTVGETVSPSEIVERAIALYLDTCLYDSIADWCAAQADKE